MLKSPNNSPDSSAEQKPFSDWVDRVLSTWTVPGENPFREVCLNAPKKTLQRVALEAVRQLEYTSNREKIVGGLFAGEALFVRQLFEPGLQVTDAARRAAVRTGTEGAHLAARFSLALNYYLIPELCSEVSFRQFSRFEYAKATSVTIENLAEFSEESMFRDGRISSKPIELLVSNIDDPQSLELRLALEQALLHFPEYLQTLEALKRPEEMAYALWRSAALLAQEVVNALCSAEVLRARERTLAYMQSPGVAHFWESIPALELKTGRSWGEHTRSIFGASVALAQAAIHNERLITAAEILDNAWSRQQSSLFLAENQNEEISMLIDFVRLEFLVNSQIASTMSSYPNNSDLADLGDKWWMQKRADHEFRLYRASKQLSHLRENPHFPVASLELLQAEEARARSLWPESQWHWKAPNAACI